MTYRSGTFCFDADEELLFRFGNIVPLRPQALRVLRVLLEQHGRLVPKEVLIKEVWPETFVEDNNLNQCITTLRRAFGDDRNGNQYIQTVFKRGFCFVAPVTIEATNVRLERVPLFSSRAASPPPENLRLGKESRVAASDSQRDDQLGPKSDTEQVFVEAAVQPLGSDASSGAPQKGIVKLPETAGLQLPIELQTYQTPLVAPSKERLEDPARSERLPSPRPRSGPWFARLSLKVVLAAVLLVVFYYLSGESSAPPNPRVLGFTQLTDDGHAKGYTNPLLTDGVRVYFKENQGAGMVLVSVSNKGGEVAPLSLPSGFWPTDISPEGSEFIGDDSTASGTENIVVASATGKSLHWLLRPPSHIGQDAWSGMASWAPDGRKVAFCYGHDLFEARSDGGEMRQIATVAGWPYWPRWSPDGRLLRFSVLNRKTETTSLWEVGADGAHLHPLPFLGSKFSRACCGSWTADGKYFIFQARQNGRYDIWALRERSTWLRRSSSNLVRLTSGPLDYFSPLPSRDGKKIFVFGGESRGELMRLDLKSRMFADFLGGISAAEVDFSRNRKWVAYVTYPDYTLWRARADGSDAMQLTFPPLEAREPHWSPDAEQIAFQGISHGSHYKIYLISRDGGELRQVIPGEGEESVATWWPDGQSILYDEPLYRRDVSQMFIHRLDLRTRKIREIPGSGGSWTARLSPDGRYIATLDATPTANPHHLYILDSVTGQQKLVVTVPDISEPTWSRDGQYVYFAQISTSMPALFRVRVYDGKLECLASLSGFPAAGVWTGVAPDGSPLLLRSTPTHELYALRVQLP
ncbi:MAG: winged helix-turn-helix domain-containing protein [Terriglobia bacterium]